MVERCSCDKFQKGIQALGAIAYNSHFHGLPYRGEDFQYCPWCGGKVDPVKFVVTQEAMNKINGLTKANGMELPR